MTNLRKAAEMALDALHNIDQSNNDDAIQALRQALAQPQWVEITKGECDELFRAASDHIEYAWAIEAKLKEKNT